MPCVRELLSPAPSISLLNPYKTVRLTHQITAVLAKSSDQDSTQKKRMFLNSLERFEHIFAQNLRF